jgi:hypothetical protein
MKRRYLRKGGKGETEKSKKGIPLFNKGIFVWVLLFIFGAIQVYFAIFVSALGADLQTLEKKEAQVTEENKVLRSQLIESTSLAKASENSESLGFAKSKETVFLGGDDFVAQGNNF